MKTAALLLAHSIGAVGACQVGMIGGGWVGAIFSVAMFTSLFLGLLLVAKVRA